jgi:hypothetical protein
LADSPHETVWRESLRELMESDWSDIRGRTTWSPEAFTSRVHAQYMSRAADVDDGFGESLRGFLRQIVPDAA